MSNVTKTFNKNSVIVAIWVLGILYGAFNIYISSQLSPLAQTVAVLATKVSAMETTNGSYVTNAQLKELDKRLDNIQGTLNILVSKQ